MLRNKARLVLVLPLPLGPVLVKVFALGERRLVHLLIGEAVVCRLLQIFMLVPVHLRTF